MHRDKKQLKISHPTLSLGYIAVYREFGGWGGFGWAGVETSYSELFAESRLV